MGGPRTAGGPLTVAVVADERDVDRRRPRSPSVGRSHGRPTLAVYRCAAARFDGMVDHDRLAEPLGGADVFDRSRLCRIDFGPVIRREIGAQCIPPLRSPTSTIW